MHNAYQIVRDFEEALAVYAGSKYAVAIESGTAAIFLSLLWHKEAGKLGEGCVLQVPKRTYPSVPMACVHAGYRIRWIDKQWVGAYSLFPLRIWDASKRFRRGMYHEFSWGEVCLSFHIKKLLPIGRGGAVLTNDEKTVAWLKKARFDGREEKPLYAPQAWDVLGWNMYMTPEQAARGLMLLSITKDDYPDQVEDPPYPDCSTFSCFAAHSV